MWFLCSGLITRSQIFFPLWFFYKKKNLSQVLDFFDLKDLQESFDILDFQELFLIYQNETKKKKKNQQQIFIHIHFFSKKHFLLNQVLHFIIEAKSTLW